MLKFPEASLCRVFCIQSWSGMNPLNNESLSFLPPKKLQVNETTEALTPASWPAQEVCWWFLTCRFLHPEILPCSTCLLVEDMLQSVLYSASPQTPPHQNTHPFQYQITWDGTISLTQLCTTGIREGLGDALDNRECHSLVRSNGFRLQS